MAVAVRSTIAALCLLLVAGCLTDELVVCKESVVVEEAMKPFLGVYRVEKWFGNDKPESLRVTEKNGEFQFSFLASGRELHFVLSKIPNSKKELYLLSIPRQDGNPADMILVGKAEKERTHIWAAFANLPVVEEHLSFQDGKAKAEDAKKFLANHADAFVTANEPQFTLEQEAS